MNYFDILLAKKLVGGGFTPTADQLAAMNSGITSEKVANYDDCYATINYNALNHNCIYRGKDLTNVYTVDQMYSMIHSGNFDDLFLGDYFTKSITTDIYTKFTGTAFESGVTYYERSGDNLLNWTYTETSDAAYDSSKTYYTKLTKTENVKLMFAAFDYYYNVGNTALTTHHAILIPRNYGFATTSKMNPTDTTVGGYYNSEMHQTTLLAMLRASRRRSIITYYRIGLSCLMLSMQVPPRWQAQE